MMLGEPTIGKRFDFPYSKWDPLREAFIPSNFFSDVIRSLVPVWHLKVKILIYIKHQDLVILKNKISYQEEGVNNLLTSNYQKPQNKMLPLLLALNSGRHYRCENLKTYQGNYSL